MDTEKSITRRNAWQNIGLLTAGTLFSTSSLIGQQTTSQNSTLFKQALIEMEATRTFLANWFSGRLVKSLNTKKFYLHKVLAENFTIVRPNGKRLSREQTLKIFFEKLHLSDPKVMRHDNRDIRLILDTGELVIVGYKESHVYADHEVINELTAVLVKDTEAPNGVKWQLVHETAIV